MVQPEPARIMSWPSSALRMSRTSLPRRTRDARALRSTGSRSAASSICSKRQIAPTSNAFLRETHPLDQIDDEATALVGLVELLRCLGCQAQARSNRIGPCPLSAQLDQRVAAVEKFLKLADDRRLEIMCRYAPGWFAVAHQRGAVGDIIAVGLLALVAWLGVIRRLSPSISLPARRLVSLAIELELRWTRPAAIVACTASQSC
jgi:hypothetical protein